METEASTSTDDELRLPAPPAPPTNTGTGTNRNRYSDESKKSSGLKGGVTGEKKQRQGKNGDSMKYVMLFYLIKHN